MAHILVVEDDYDISNMLQIFFKGQGHRVEITDNGSDAVKLCLGKMPNLIILDIMLPDTNGYELCKQWRGSPRTAHIPIIFLTQKDERSDKIEGLRLGANDYINKPFDIEELKLRVHNLLQEAQRYNSSHPLTGFPSDRTLKDYWKDLLEIQSWTYLEIAMNQLEAIKAHYGSEIRDNLLQKIAQTLNGIIIEYGTENDFLGHTIENVFCLITLADDESTVIAAVRQKLNEQLDLFLEEEIVPEESELGWESLASLVDISVGTVFGKAKPYANLPAIEQEARESRLLDSYLAKSPFWGREQEAGQWLGQIIDWMAVGIQLTIPTQLAREANQQQKILESLAKTLLDVRAAEADRIFYLSQSRFILVTQTANLTQLRARIEYAFYSQLSAHLSPDKAVPELSINWTSPHHERVLDISHLFGLLFGMAEQEHLLLTRLTDKHEIINWSKFHILLIRHFNLSELKELCHDLQIDPEEILRVGDGRRAVCRNLIDYCQRHTKTDKLVACCQTLRPDVDWPVTNL